MPRPWSRPTPTAEPDRPVRASSLASLRVPRYRRFICSQVLNSLCLWAHRTSHIWLTVVVTDGDPVVVGTVTALQFLPMLLSAVGGGLGDRWSKRRVLLISQAVAVAGCLVLAALAHADAAGPAVLGAMAVVLGLSAAVDAPVRLAFPREIVDRQLIASAIGVNGLVFQTARVAGPAVAGLVIARWSEGAGLLFAAACGVGALVALATVGRTPARPAGAAARPPWRGTLRTVARTPGLATPVVGALIVGACLADLQVALPLMLDAIPGAGVGDFGLAVATLGVGGAAGALLAAVAAPAATAARLDVSLTLFALVALAAALMPVVSLLAAALLVAGVAMQFYNTNAITLLQVSSPDGQHGRVMGLYVVAFFVWSGLGTPLFGLAAAAVGPRPALAASSLVCALAGAAMALRRALVVRPPTPTPSLDGPAVKELS